MFHAMRRKRQLLTEEQSLEILRRGTSGVLSMQGDDGYAYGVPLSYVYKEGKLYFHSAVSGHKLDCIRREGRVSFCVIGQDQVMPAEYTTYFRSVIVFGRARVLGDEAEKRRALELLAEKYAPGPGEARRLEVEKELPRVCIVELSVEHMTGKEAVELVREKRGGGPKA